MRVIADDRRTGKTTELIRWAAEPETPGRPRYIAVFSQGRARQVADMARELGLKIRFPVTFDEVLMGLHRGRRLELGVDDAEQLIAQVLSPQDVSVVTILKAGD